MKTSTAIPALRNTLSVVRSAVRNKTSVDWNIASVAGVIAGSASTVGCSLIRPRNHTWCDAGIVTMRRVE